jgi:hypothetical protein
MVTVAHTYNLSYLGKAEFRSSRPARATQGESIKKKKRGKTTI